jgi:hypothetical protein
MHTSRLTKLLLVWIPTQLWLLQAHAGLGRTLVAGLGAGLVTWAWIALSARRDAAGAGATPPGPSLGARRAERRFDRTPRGRLPRDVRCPMSGAARPSTRR